MAKHLSLADLTAETPVDDTPIVVAAAQPEPPAQEQPPAPAAKKAAPAKKAAAAKKAAPRRRPAKKAAPVPENRVRGRQEDDLVRKETYLWPDQRKALHDLEWVLERARPRAQGERITSNTLIRVAVDRFLSEAGNLKGVTEAELLASVTPKEES